MIRHIVLFKVRDNVPAEQKASQLKTLKADFEALVGQIPSLRSIEIGLNVNPQEKFDLSLTAVFDDMAGLQAYAVDPRHVAVASRLRPILDARACNDYEF